MDGARASHTPYPGEFRRTQNWIGGTSPEKAQFVPPPPHEVMNALSDLEKFIHSQDYSHVPLIKAALIHAQFETIHPFVDGNGRTGRLLITMYLHEEKLLEVPILYLSDYFKMHQQLYYQRLEGYHSDPALVDDWVEFCLQGFADSAAVAIEIASRINVIRDRDMSLVATLGKAAAETSMNILRHLYAQPIVDVPKIQEWTQFTRAGAQRAVDRLIDIGILSPLDPHRKYGRAYAYREYLALFAR
jgi:Fic family protein